jgi:transcriptional regulator with XRE-family HTH domain
MDLDIGGALKLWRKKAGMSAKDVIAALAARGIDISINTLYNYESNNRMPNADVLVMIMDVLNVNDALDYFPSQRKKEVPALPIKEQEPTEEQLDQMLIALPVAVKRQVVSLVDAILGPPIQLSETSAARMAKLAAELDSQHVDGGNDDLEAQVD